MGLGDTDAAGLIYFAAVFRWSEVLLSDWLCEVGHPLGSLIDSGVGIPVVRAESRYLAPLGLDDRMDLELRTAHVGTSSFRVSMRGTRTHDQTLAVETRVWHACLALDPTAGTTRPTLRKANMPAWLREALDG